MGRERPPSWSGGRTGRGRQWPPASWVGVAVPTPGQVGGFHTMYRIAVVTFFGVPETTAVGAAIVLHAVSFVPVTLLGLAFMAREGLSLGRMRALAAEEPDAATASE